MGRWKRGILGVLLGVAVVTTLVTVWALIWRDPHDREMFVLLAMGMGYLVTMGFAALVAVEKPGVRWAAAAGMSLTFLMMAVLPVMLCMEEWVRRRGSSWPGGDFLPQGMGIGMVTAGVLSLSALVLTPKLRWPGRIMQAGTVGALISAGGLMAMAMTDHYSGRDVEQALMLAMVLAGGGLVGVWGLARWLAVKMPDPLSTMDQRLWLRCARCGREQELGMGESHCAGCGLWFKIEMEEPKCAGCGYNLRGLSHAVCPECGKAIVKGAVGSGVAV